MSAGNLAKALAFIDDDEGPELNVSASEPGGSSKHGVSMTVLREWHNQHGLPAPSMDDMRAVDAVLAGKIYAARFAEPIRFNDLPPGVDYRMLDIAVNLGVTGGIRALQLSLQRWPVDGRMSDEVITDAKKADPRSLVMGLSGVWIGIKYGSPSWGPSGVTRTGFGHGWSNRNMKATARALAFLGETWRG